MPSEAEHRTAQTEEFVPAFVVQGSSDDLGQALTSLESLRQEYVRCSLHKYEEKLKIARAIYFRVSRETPEDTGGVIFISVPVYDFVKGGEGVRGEIEKPEEFMQKGGNIFRENAFGICKDDHVGRTR